MVVTFTYQLTHLFTCSVCVPLYKGHYSTPASYHSYHNQPMNYPSPDIYHQSEQKGFQFQNTFIRDLVACSHISLGDWTSLAIFHKKSSHHYSSYTLCFYVYPATFFCTASNQQPYKLEPSDRLTVTSHHQVWYVAKLSHVITWYITINHRLSRILVHLVLLTYHPYNQYAH